MVKQNKAFLLFALVGATLVGCSSVNSSALIETATDLLSNEKGIRLSSDEGSYVGSDAVVDYSPTYAQYGTNPETGNRILRFATAVKGAIESLTYTRAPIAGEEKSHVKEVYSLYAGIMADSEVQYYTAEGLSQSEEDKGQYYWACYSIEYTSVEKYNIDVDVTFSVNGEVAGTKVANLQHMIDADTKLYRSIYIDGDVHVRHGQNINTAEFVVKAINHDGSEITLDPADYAITSSKVASFGEKATLEVVHNQDSALTASKDVIVTKRVEGESGTVVGGKVVNETEYSVVDGAFVSGGKVGAAGGFASEVNKGNEGSLTLTYVSKTDHVGGLTMRISNSNLTISSGTSYYMKELQLNTIVDLSVNGSNLAVGDNVVIGGTPVYPTAGTYAPLYNIYNSISFENIPFKAGINTLKFNFKKSTINEINKWEESPSEFNVDYVDFYSVGTEVDEINSGLTLDSNSVINPSYAQTKEDFLKSIKVIATATTVSGKTLWFDNDDLSISVSGGNHSYMEETEDYIVFGDHTLSFSLLGNENVSGSYTFNVKEEEKITKIQGVSLRLVNNRVYYCINGLSRGVAANEVELFDGSNVIPTEWTFGLNTFECRADVTDYAATTSAGTACFWPHFRVNGKNFDGSNGDVKYTEYAKFHNTVVYCNNKRFQLCGDQYKMPVCYVGKLDYSSGTKDAIITDASLIKEDDKVYYQLTGYAYNIALDKIVLKELDSSTRTVVLDQNNPYKFIFKYDISNVTTAIWPHLTIDGASYATNKAGDLKWHRVTANGTTFFNLDLKDSNARSDVGDAISHGGRKYQLFTQYGMPVVDVTA